jgi:glycine dehydrogenase subunit 1
VTFVPLAASERAAMLDALGIDDVERLFDVIPAPLRFPEIDVGSALSEMEVISEIEALAGENRSAAALPCFLGAGAYRHFIPTAVGAILGRSEFSTSYTPYQPEVSQGTLQASFEFQSMICALTAMDVSNASVYDGASALGEAALMALRVTGRDRMVISGSVHPHYRQVLDAYVGPRQTERRTTRVWLDQEEAGTPRISEEDLAPLVDPNTACVVVSQPTYFGEIRDLEPVVRAAHAVGALVIEVYNPTSLGLLKPPGEWGADVAVGEGQCLGIPLSFGGPYLGLMSCRHELVRQLPGRIVGQTADASGRRGFVLTLQAREQHIRREKATSNICTSQTLIALGATVYLALLGPRGLRAVAESCHQKTRYLAQQLASIAGVQIVSVSPHFHEVAVQTPLTAAELNRGLLDQGIIGGVDLGAHYPELERSVLLCCTELTGRAHIDRLCEAVAALVGHEARATARTAG